MQFTAGLLERETSHMSAMQTLFNACRDEIENGDLAKGFTQLSEELTEHRLKLNEDDWSAQVLKVFRSHPLARILQEDPYTRRALEKPRGYAGDAVMMDYMNFQQPPRGCSKLGERIFRAVVASPNGASVRWRCEYLAGLIAREAQCRSSLSVLSVACGHCREGLMLQPATKARIKRLIALDQDAKSLEVVRNSLKGFVTPVRMNVKDIATDSSLGSFDLIYSAGLFDYLPDRAATALCTALLKRTTSGGTLLIANFTPDNWGRGYMETVMDWHLILRTKDAMRTLIPASQVAKSYLHFDPYRNVIYLEITKA